MNNINELNSKKFIDSETMKKIREHASLYDSTYDKKEFLKKVSVHEQKIILMNSSKPYEVLNYLDELDLKSSRLLLEELNFEEIKHIISLFSAEDKKRFYATFSDLSLVNQFIVQDKYSSTHVQNLSFERKVDLIDSSDNQTQVATSVIYESMPYEERVSAVEKVTDVDAMNVLEGTEAYSTVQLQETHDNVEQQVEQSEQAQEQSQNQQEEQVQEENAQEKLQEKLPEEKEEQKEKEEAEEKLQEKNDEEKNIEEQIAKEVAQEVSFEIVSDILEEFQQERNRCEQQEILNLITQNQQDTLDESAKVM